MFYILSKIFNFFLAPANWIIILLLLAYFTRRTIIRKRYLVSALIIFLIFSNEAILNKCFNAWQADPIILSATNNYSVGIVLGGMSMTDKNNKSFLSESADRFVQTLLLYKKGVIKKILISGANYEKDEQPEADFIKGLLIEAGVPAADIFAETKAKNTFENGTFSKAIIDSLQAPPPYVVITSAFHTRRSKLVFEKAGLPVIMYPSAYITINKKLDVSDFILPKIDILDNWKFLTKEVFGVVIYKLTGKA